MPAMSPPIAVSDETYDLSLLQTSIERWRTKPALRDVYADMYRQMGAFGAVGPSLEVGSGCGTMRAFIPGIITSDIRKTRFVDVAASAYELEAVPGGPWATIYALDVLHHLCTPFRFFASAANALRPGGRLVLMEPAATPLGRWFYRFCHHEPIRPDEIVPPYSLEPDKNGEFANMGMAWSLFVRDLGQVRTELRKRGLTVRLVRFRDVLAYPATGGFSGPSLLPRALTSMLATMERLLPQSFLRVFGLRMMLVLEKSTPPSDSLFRENRSHRAAWPRPLGGDVERDTSHASPAATAERRS